MAYAIAYNDKLGNGFSETEPWILNDFDDRKQCIIKANELIREWYQNVTIFTYNKLPEIITWDYVRKHQV